MYEDLFDLMVKGAFADRAEFDLFVSEATQEEIYSLITEGAFKDFEEFKSLYGDSTPQVVVEEKKKKDTTQENPFSPSTDQELPDMPEYQSKSSVSKSTLGVQESEEEVPDEETSVIELTLEDDIDPFEQSLNKVINPDLIASTEEEVLPQMVNYFSDYGFKFKKSDILGDGMTVESENGEQHYVNLDRLFFKQDTADELKKFLKENRKENEAILNQAGTYVENRKKAYEQKEIDDAIKLLQKQTEDYTSRLKEYALFKDNLDRYYKQKLSNVTREELQNDPTLRENYEKWAKANAKSTQMLSDLRAEDESFKIQGAQLDKLAGEYTSMKEKQGSYLGGIYNAFLDGAARISTSTLNNLIDAMTYFMDDAGMAAESYTSEIARVALSNNSFEEGKFKETISKDKIKNGMIEVTDPELGTSKMISIDSLPSVYDLSREQLVKELGGDTNDVLQLADDYLRAIRSPLTVMTKMPFGAIDIPNLVKETEFDKAAAKVLDLARKGLKYEEGYQKAVEKDIKGGRFINPYSYAARTKDQTLGMLDAGRKGYREVLGSKGTTKEWSDLEKQSFWGGAILGLSESLPAMIGGSNPAGWAQRTAQMYAQVTDHVYEEMEKDPSFDMISENEKQAVTIPIGIAVGTLESYGLRNVIAQKGLLNSVIAKAVARSSKNTTGKSFSNFIRQDVENRIARGLLTVTAAGLAEYETGAAQEAIEITIKDIYNDIKDKDMFQTPDTWQDWVAQVNRAGLQEAVGGFILGTPGAVSNSVAGLDVQNLDNTVFEVFEKMSQDEQYTSMYVTKLKQKISDSTDPKTKEDAENELALVKRLQGILPQIPSEYNTDQRKEALQLIYQKESLENEIKSQDKILSKPKQDLLNKINDRLNAIVGEVTTEQQKDKAQEQKISDFEVTDTQVKTEGDVTQVKTEGDVTQQEQEDIDAFFGETKDTSEVKAQNLAINRSEDGSKNTNPFRSSVVKIADLGARAIAKVLPNVRIVMHETNEQYLKYAKLGDGRAEYNPDNTTIHINLSKATKTTVPHEIFHAVLMEKIKTDPAIAKAAEQMVLSVQKVLPKDSELGKRIEKFAQTYEGEFQNEERLAELVGILSSEYRQLDRPSKNVIIEFLKSIARKFGINIGSDFGTKDADVIDLLNVISRKTRTGEVIEEADISTLEEINKEQGTEGEVGTVRIPQQKIEVIESPKVESDPRPWVRSVVQNIDINDLEGRNFITNMYDYTNAGLTELGNGFSIELLGGRNYVPIIMNKTGKSLGDVSNLAAFNTKSQAEGFVRNSKDGNANLFAPHSGTLNESWQFQQHIFEQLVDLVLDNKILSKQKLITVFNSGLKSKTGKDALQKFNKKNKTNLRNLNSFKSNPKELVRLLDIKNNYSPDLRKILNQKIASDKSFQKAIGIENLEQFHQKMMDPLNKGIVGGEIMTFIEFDPTTFEISQTNPKDVDHHPSFGWVVKAKINKIFQPNKFYKSYDLTESYTKYNTEGPSTSRKAEVGKKKFEQSNVKSSAGAIPKVAKVTTTKQRQQRSLEEIARFYNMDTNGFLPKQVDLYRLKKELPQGIGVKQSRVDAFGRGGSYFLTNARGSKINPYKNKARQQKDIEDYIKESRENNFREEVIKDFLVRVKKFPAKLVNKLMEVDVDLFSKLPKSFGNVKGGTEVGIKLYNKVKAFEEKLIKSNKRKKVKLTEQQIADQTIEFLQKQPEYKAEGDKKSKTISTQQAQMLIDMQSALGIRPSENMGEKIKAAKSFVKQRRKGAKDLQNIKTQVRNFIRKSLPRELFFEKKGEKLITKKDVMTLINKVNSATEKNIENILQEVTDFVVEKNINSLQNKINGVLNGKYQAVVGGKLKPRKIADSIRKRIDKIKSNLVGPNPTKEQVGEINEKLLERFNELSIEPQQTVEQREEMVDLQLAMSYNNAMLMSEIDAEKVKVLDGIYSTLDEMIKFGRSLLQEELLRMHQYYNEQFTKGYEAITGDVIDMTDPDAKTELSKISKKRKQDLKRKKATQNVVKRFFSEVLGKLDKYVFGTAEALDGLMMRIDKLPGEMFGGRLNEMFTDEVDASSRRFKMRMMEVESIISGYLYELYGKNWKKISRQNRKQVQYDIEIQDGIMLEPISQDQIAYLYNMYKDPANRASFANPDMYGVEVINKDDSAAEKKRKKELNQANADRVMKELESKLDPKVKELADWQVEVLYPALYEEYNNAYKKLYRTDLPMNRFYAGTIYRDGVSENEIEVMNLLGKGNMYNMMVGANATKVRQNSSLPIKPMNQMDVLNTYINEMEYFAAFGETIRDMNKFFSNKYVKSAITDIHGKEIYSFVMKIIDTIATRGQSKGFKASVINFMNNTFILGRLAVSPVITIKQLTSMFTYANDIGFSNWLKYAAKNKTQQLKVWKEVTENSVYMKDRNNQSIMKAIETYSDEKMKEFVPRPTKDWLLNFAMYTTKLGDRGAIMLGGLPNYSYYKAEYKKKNPTASDQEAIDYAIIKFEKDTKRTQQSADLQDKDYYQTSSHPLARAMNMFLTTPKQYLRKEIIATRELYRAMSGKAYKGTVAQNIRTFLMYHIFMPTLFQYVSMGLPGILRGWRDDDEEDLLRAGIIGNLNALFIIGELAAAAGDTFTDKPYAGTSAKQVGILQIANAALRRLRKARATKDPEKRAKAMKDFYLELATITGLPMPTISRFFDNYSELGREDDIGKAILRLLNYSNYQIEGPKKRGSSRSAGSIDFNKKLQKMQREYEKEQRKNRINKGGLGSGSRLGSGLKLGN